MPAVNIIVSEDDFDAGLELKRLHCGDSKVGAICSFIGYVREFGSGSGFQGLEVEHYPGMTEKAIQDIAEEACKRWPLINVSILHRVGRLSLAEQIVMVACASAHRKAAFSGCEFIIDFLKVRAPFWKKEITSERDAWVEAKKSDQKFAENWQFPDKNND